MVVIKFPDQETLEEGLGFLVGRFSGRAFRSGEVIVPEIALEALASENLSFTVLGQASYEQMVLPGELLYHRGLMPWQSPSSA